MGGELNIFFAGPKLPTSKTLRHVVRAILSVPPKCSHRCVSLRGSRQGLRPGVPATGVRNLRSAQSVQERVQKVF